MSATTASHGIAGDAFDTQLSEMYMHSRGHASGVDPSQIQYT